MWEDRNFAQTLFGDLTLPVIDLAPRQAVSRHEVERYHQLRQYVQSENIVPRAQRLIFDPKRKLSVFLRPSDAAEAK